MQKWKVKILKSKMHCKQPHLMTKKNKPNDIYTVKELNSTRISKLKILITTKIIKWPKQEVKILFL